MAEEMERKAMKLVAYLAGALFVIAILFGVTYIGTDYLRQTTCENINSYVYEGGDCLNSSVATGGTEQTLKPIESIDTVELAIDLALGLLGLVVLILMFAVVIRTTKAMNQSN